MNAVQDHAAQAPGALPIAMPAPASLLPYNISLNLSSIFAMLPTSRLLTRIRRGMLWNGRDQMQFPATSATIDWTLPEVPQPQAEVTSTGPTLPLDSFPGPWAFFTSWYMLGLFLMAVLLHRIQNVIIPSRGIQHRRQRHAYRFAPNFASSRFTPELSRMRRFYNWLLPLDFSRTTTRLVLHLPSAYFLSKMLLIWVLIVIQTSEIQKPLEWTGFGWLNSLVQWSSAKEMTDICWGTFCAVCAAFLVEGFVKALDGMGTGFPIGSANPNTSPFNLVGYAFLLHVYSSPVTHSFKPSDDGPSRPDKHVLITITIPLLQLTVFHLLSISKRLSTHRLLPTALASMLSLLHFHGTLFSHYRRSQLTPTPLPTPSEPTGALRRGSSHINYPLLNYIPNFFETLLICTILLTVLLNAFAQLLVRGRIDRVLSGLGIGHGSTLHDDDTGAQGFFANLPMDEDFGVLLLRVGIASLEATGLRGWGNEVAPIPLPSLRTRSSRKAHLASGAASASPTHGSVRLGRMDVAEVQYGTTYIPPSSASRVASGSAAPSKLLDHIWFAEQTGSGGRPRRRGPGGPLKKEFRRGLSNEVRTIDLGNAEGAGAAQGRAGYTPWWRWLREFAAYLGALWGVLRGLVVFLLDRARGRVRISERIAKRSRTPLDVSGEATETEVGGDDVDADVRDAEARRRRDKALYERFVRGEDISDDEDEEEDDTPTEPDDNDGDSAGSDDDVELEDEREAEAITLFTDLLRNGGASSALAGRGGGGEMVLAHLVSPSSGPLTRRRWNALMESGAGGEGVERWGADEVDDEVWEASRRNIFDEQDEGAAGRFESACVICTSEKRDIICWPCRCLAMCDNCREALASKSAPTKHRCPCCRQSVDGYSKIYIP